MNLFSHFLGSGKDPGRSDGQEAAASVNDTGDEAVNLGDLMNGKNVSEAAAKAKETVPAGTKQDANSVQTFADLELSTMLLQAIMDHSSDVIYFKDLTSRFIMVNAALAKKHLSTSNTAQAIGRTDFDFFAQEHARKAYDDEQQIIATGTPLIDIEEKEVWPDGHETWAKTSKYPLRNAGGKIVGTWGISRDISDQKRTEQELRSSEEQLRHAQKMEVFGQLAGGIAHDFNNLISVIFNAAQLVEMGLQENSGDTKRHVDMIIDTSKRAAELTQQLLLFARKGKFTIAPIDVHEVLHSVFRLTSNTFDKRIRVVERLNAKTSIIMGDFAQLQNALFNLAINARDAMPEGGLLSFTTDVVGPSIDEDGTRHGTVTPGCFLRLRVSDTGCGMSQNTKVHLFEPFFTTKAPGKGTGLGLASVFGTVKKFGGIIEFDSEVNRGTTFTLFLPLVVNNEAAQVADTTCDVVPKRGIRLLIVEDEKDLRVALVEMLENLGYESFACSDGIDAVEHFSKHHADYDAVIVDLTMPRMGGYECIHLLKQIKPMVRILVSSGYNITTDTQKIIIKGISGFIHKPYQMSEIAKILHDLLTRQ